MALANAAMLIYLLWPAKIIEGMVRRPPPYYGIRPTFCGWGWCTERLQGWKWLVFYLELYKSPFGVNYS